MGQFSLLNNSKTFIAASVTRLDRIHENGMGQLPQCYAACLLQHSWPDTRHPEYGTGMAFILPVERYFSVE